MRYRLICADIDGTLVNRQGLMTEENRQAIRRLEEENVIFAICSGRMLRAVELMADFYGIESYIVCSNGAIVTDYKKKETIYHSWMSEEEMKEIFDYAKKYNCMIGLNTREGMIYNDKNCIEEGIYTNANQLYGTENKKIELCRTKEYQEKSRMKNIAKISLWTRNQQDYLTLWNEIEQTGHFTMAHAMPVNIELTRKGVSKWGGIEKIMERNGIKREEVLCIGDTMNDYEMIVNAGLGVCMENGMKKLKEASDYITKSNDDSGVAFVIDQCLKGEKML
ncbi:MAG: HAD family hydrolase [Lachnospiraceae bacterium]|nr:HAD family hydrolase [Lachnospiraceae bacterium]